ncbi:CDP-glycerol glycerophosphotransferase family protein [candidate division KSB1 bacterium]|nr:CDP-glycerol glycerophosphotransferase family protein [candidate division KSB1 bacterium]
MVLSGYLLKIPYGIVWYFLKATGRLDELALYCANVEDYLVIENVIPHLRLKPIIIAKNKATQRELRRIGVDSKIWPAYPEKIIMARHALHKFPLCAIFKIGMRHGPYHFKKFIKKERYNSFNVFLFTSNDEVATARQKGISNAENGGYPKLDSFKKPEIKDRAAKLEREYNDGKIKLLFSATYDRSGISAIEQWYSRLDKLTDRYHIFVTLHPLMSPHYREYLLNVRNILLIEPKELMEYMLLCDILISDTSSIIGEFCSLDKPIITFKVEGRGRFDEKTADMIRKISIQIDDFTQLESVIDDYMKDSTIRQPERAQFNVVMFDDLQASHGQRAAKIINRML